MGITSNISRDDVKGRFDAFLEQIRQQQIKRLQRLGEMCVTHARNVPKEQGFQDQTGNLRSSIGYAVFEDGVAIHTMYEAIKGGSEGARKGEALANKVGSQKPGICLVVTAGMNYAIYVESKGRDVITSAEHMAERELPRMLAKLVQNIKRAAE